MRYDIAVIGGGPAGYTAALYASRAGRTVVLFEKGSAGGQMGVTSTIENYPGYESVDGFTLAVKMEAQARAAGAEIVSAEVTGMTDGEQKTVRTTAGEYEAGAVIIATGARPRKLGVAGEAEYTGRGVSYCATCDGGFFRKKTVVVCGGGETALEDAAYLSNICENVIIVHRRDEFRASKYSVDKIKAKSNVTLKLGAVVSEVIGDGRRVCGVRLIYTDGREETVDTSGVFIAVGRVPETDVFDGLVERDGGGYIVAGEDTKTSCGGIFAAGDVRTKALRQIVTAASDGAVAARSAEEWLGNIRK